MLWLIYAFLSAVFLGCYDSFKKKTLADNAVIPVLFLNTLFCSLLFLPMIVLSYQTDFLDGTPFHVARGGWMEHRYLILKSALVLSSWICGYFAIKHLPLTIAGPINATRPVMVLVGALLIFGEQLNAFQWIGVALSILSFFMLSRSGKKEGIDFRHNAWILLIVLAAMLGALSALYDKYLMAGTQDGGLGIDRMLVQSWYNIYQCLMMGIILLVLWWPKHRQTTPFRWDWGIIGVSLFLSVADFLYFYALTIPDALLSVMSMVRRGSVVVTFLFGALFFHEHNLKAKAFDLFLVLLGMLFLYFGS